MTRIQKIITAGLIAGVVALTPWTARATEIVFDPTNYGKAVEQLQQNIQMLQTLRQQVQNQLLMLQNWGYSELSGIVQSMQRGQSALADSGAYAQADAASQLETTFPLDPQAYASTTGAQMDQQRSAWDQRQRDALVENRQVQNRIVQDMPATAQRMQNYVDQSAQAPGVTAALQAGNEELATVLAQIQALQALEITAARAETESEAQLQSEDAYAMAEGQKVLGSPPAAAPTAPLQNVFVYAPN